MSKENLTPQQLTQAEELDKVLQRLSNIKDELKQYKLGDVYVLEEWYRHDPKSVDTQKSHMGFPVKYKVFYVSPQGIPYFRQMTSKGNPTGNADFPPEIDMLHLLKQANHQSTYGDSLCQKFVPDPEQLDAILLQQEFDPMAQHREKSKLYNEINKHNKQALIPTGYNQGIHVSTFFKSKQAGDKFWTSIDKQYIFQSLLKVGKEWQITATDMNQATVTFGFSDFYCKRLYKEQPRSFSKESKT